VSWFNVAPGARFGTAELPYGIFSVGDERPRMGVAVGDQIVDVARLARAAGFDAEVFERPSLNAFMALGPSAWAEARDLLRTLLDDDSGRDVLEPHLVPIRSATLHLPIEVADYVDFYASEQHARNIGAIFRPGAEPLTPNWKHMPIGYHGRAGTVVVSGTEVVRPAGQRKAPGEEGPTYGPTTKLDLEAELGWVIGVGSGGPVRVEDFAAHIFGVVILNDWSARDIQAWEYVPLGPFLGKSFTTSISAWVLPLAALGDVEVDLPPQHPALLPYLQGPGSGYDIDLEVELNGTLLSTCPYAEMYYSPAQLVAHTTVNGARLRTGDLLGSGTVSGSRRDQRGSLMELSWNGAEPYPVGSATRSFLEDGDEVVLRATAGPLRLGEVRGRVVPARP
jgi:fumarylacetoacetase